MVIDPSHFILFEKMNTDDTDFSDLNGLVGMPCELLVTTIF
ncbi:MAG: hypothetical protein RL090_1958 [Bacteroidota bacterium]|jgi:hypothetical protein